MKILVSAEMTQHSCLKVIRVMRLWRIYGRGGDRRHSLLLHVPDQPACCCNSIHIILKFQAPLHEMANIGEAIDEVIPQSIGLS